MSGTGGKKDKSATIGVSRKHSMHQKLFGGREDKKVGWLYFCCYPFLIKISNLSRKRVNFSQNSKSIRFISS